MQVLVGSMEQAKKLGKFSQKAESYARKKWPGPTLIVPKTRNVTKLVTGGSSKVGLRLPDHRTILRLIKECGPIAATSANRSGAKPALTAAQVKRSLPEVKFVLSGRIKSGKPSPVIDTTKGFKVLRK
ncbi:L-threonylcarbamoyladenylate synthase [Candidatus Margulisiibacteriota bacterium]